MFDISPSLFLQPKTDGKIEELTNDIILRRHRRILLLQPRSRTVRQTSDLCVLVRIAEEGHGLTLGSYGMCVADAYGWGRDDAVEGRADDVVGPAGEKVACVDYYGSRLWCRGSTARFSNVGKR